MNKPRSESFDPKILRNRITVTDRELPYLLGMGIHAARIYAEQCSAIIIINGRKVYSVAKLIEGSKALAI